MRLLVLTQKVDRDDAVLGFFHRWLEAFASRFESILVICLEEGTHDLPRNVEVLSLGKEAGVGRRTYLKRLFFYVWSRRSEYDSVFVHMNQEYVVLCGLLWRALGKRVVMWRNHPHGDMMTTFAVLLSHSVMCTSPRSYTARFRKTKLMPAGIDTDFFRPANDGTVIPNSVLFLGRISAVKNIDVFLDAIGFLWEQGIAVRASIVGDAPGRDREYYREIRKKAARLEKEGCVRFFEAVPQSAVPDLYSSHQVVVNLTPEGSYDKTVPEAMSCSRIVLMSNRSFERLVPAEFRENLFFEEGNEEELARRIKKALSMPDGMGTEIGRVLRRSVIERESLKKLADLLVESFG